MSKKSIFTHIGIIKMNWNYFIIRLYGSATGLNFASWMAFNIPGMLINIFFTWIRLQFLFLGFKRLFIIHNFYITKWLLKILMKWLRTTREEREKGIVIKQLIGDKYNELGPMSFHQLATLILFILCVLLWFFRDPQFIVGWAQLLHPSPYIWLNDRWLTAVNWIVNYWICY